MEWGGPSEGFQHPLQWPRLFLSFSGARSEAEEDDAGTREARPGSHGGNLTSSSPLDPTDEDLCLP